MAEYPPQQPAPPPYAYPYRPEKDYLGQAFITLILYYVGLGIVGLIANIMFLNSARRDERQGVVTRNVGCLQILLWVHIGLMVLGCIATIIILALGGFGVVLEAING
jgi:hypothetical protein